MRLFSRCDALNCSNAPPERYELFWDLRGRSFSLSKGHFLWRTVRQKLWRTEFLRFLCFCPLAYWGAFCRLFTVSRALSPEKQQVDTRQVPLAWPSDGALMDACITCWVTALSIYRLADEETWTQTDLHCWFENQTRPCRTRSPIPDRRAQNPGKLTVLTWWWLIIRTSLTSPFVTSSITRTTTITTPTTSRAPGTEFRRAMGRDISSMVREWMKFMITSKWIFFF